MQSSPLAPSPHRFAILAKLNRPWLPTAFPRERLFQRLDELADRPCTWIGAPGGYGKTTLAASYIDARGLPCLWYQIDEDDADLATFFYYLGMAASAWDDGPPLPLLTPEYQADIPAFTRRYIRLLCQRLSLPFVLLLDNYHRLPAEAAFHGMLAEALNHLPARARCLIASRGEPPPSLARVRVHGQLAVMGTEELQLTLPEAEGIADLHFEHRPANDTVERLYAQVQGWVAGLTLLLRRSPSSLASPPLTTSALLFDYFAAEVFEQADPAMQQFLLKTAFLPKMTAQMADQLTDSGGAEERLNGLVRSHYFIFRNEAAESSYQYHDLFRDFLLSRGRQTFSATERVQYQRRAATLLETADEIGAAVELRQALGDWEALTELVLKQAESLLRQGRSQLLETWLTGFPASVCEQSPWLLYWLGLCELHRTPVAARKTLVRAYRRFKHANNSAGLWLAWAAITDTYCLAWDNFKVAACWLVEFERLRDRYPNFSSTILEARVICGVVNIMVHAWPDHPEFPDWERRLAQLLETDCPAGIYMVSLTTLPLYYTWNVGQRRKTVWSLNLLHTANTYKTHSDPALCCLEYWGEFSYRYIFEGDVLRCLALAETASKTADEYGFHLAEPFRSGLVIVDLTMGRLEAGRAALERFKPILKSFRPAERLHYEWLRSWEAWLSGRLPEALEILEQNLPVARRTFYYSTGLMHWGLAQVQASLNNRAAALRHLAGLRWWFRIANSQIALFVRSLAAAQFALAWGRRERCLRLLKGAFALGRAENLIFLPFFKAEDIARLCGVALETDIEPDYARTLIRKRGLSPDASTPPPEHWPWPVKLYTLGQFSIVVDDQPLTCGRKAQRKPLELLKLLIAWGGRDVNQARIADMLWPDIDGDIAQQAMSTTLHRLRKLLGHNEAIHLRDGRLSLDSRYCWVDVWCLERHINRAHGYSSKRQEGQDSSPPTDTDAVTALAHTLLQTYRGPFLGQDTQAWALQTRQALQDKYLRSLMEVGASLETLKNWQIAGACYRQVLAMAPTSERASQGLGRCNQRLPPSGITIEPH